MRRTVMLVVFGVLVTGLLLGCGEKPGTPTGSSSEQTRSESLRKVMNESDKLGAKDKEVTDAAVVSALREHPDYRDKYPEPAASTPATPPAGDTQPGATEPGATEPGTIDMGATSTTTVEIEMTTEQKRAMLQMLLANPDAQKQMIDDFNVKMEQQSERDEFLKEMESEEERKLFQEMMIEKVPGFKEAFEAKAEKYPELKTVLEEPSE